MKMLNKIIGSSIAVAAVLALSASTTQAQLVNGYFDQVGAINTGNGWTANPITLTSGPGGISGINQGWARFGSSQNDMSSSIDSPLSDGYALLVTQAPGVAWNAQGAYQILGGVVPGVAYTYTMNMLTDTGFSALNSGNFGTNGIYATPVDLSIAFQDSAMVTIAGTSVGGFVAANTPTAVDTWTPSSVTSAVAPANAAYAIVYAMFMESGKQTTTLNMYFDNGSLTPNLVPEPSSLALVGMGLAIPFYFIRRRKS